MWQRAAATARSLPTLGIKSHTDACTDVVARVVAMGQILDHRETVMGLCRLPRTVRKSVGERWRDGAGCLLTLGIGSHRCFARMLARAVDATDFGPSGKRDGAVPAGAHSLQEHRRAMARRRRQLAYL